MAWAILIVIVLVVSSKAARKVEQVKANGKRSLIPVLIIVVLIGLALAGSH